MQDRDPAPGNAPTAYDLEQKERIKGGFMKLRESLRMLLDGEVEAVSTENGLYFYPADLETESMVIHKTPQMETVEVEIWMRVNNQTGEPVGRFYTSAAGAACSTTTGFSVAKFTSIMDIPLKPKVKHRMEISSMAVSISKTTLISSIDYQFFAEWRE
jgi:hypothetical protein